MTKLLLKTLALSAVVALTFTACSSKKEVKKDDKLVFACKQDGVLAPKWTCNPQAKDSLAAVGIAKMNAGNDKSLQRSEAMADGRSALASQISSKVSNLFKSYKGVTGSGTAATFDASSSRVSKQLANETLQGSSAIDSWKNPTTNELYLLVTVSSTPVKKAMGNAIKTSFKNDDAMYQKFLAKMADGDLDKELEKANK